MKVGEGLGRGNEAAGVDAQRADAEGCHIRHVDAERGHAGDGETGALAHHLLDHGPLMRGQGLPIALRDEESQRPGNGAVGIERHQELLGGCLVAQ
ncbi:hypothetical protein D3C87_1819450 [compost metagenome]